MAGIRQLRSDLARICLPRRDDRPEQVLSWINSVCILFLAVGISGVRPKLPAPKALPPMEQAMPVLIQPVIPPPTTKQVVPTTQESAQNQPESQRVVVVTPVSPAINFSVPAIGNLLVPNAIAVAPPPAALNVKPAPAAIREAPKRVGSTGRGGDRPQPPYPEMAFKFGQQGTVKILLTVDESGVIKSATVTQTSGSPILDHGALEFIRKHWVLPTGRDGRLFEASITYRLQND